MSKNIDCGNSYEIPDMLKDYLSVLKYSEQISSAIHFTIHNMESEKAKLNNKCNKEIDILSANFPFDSDSAHLLEALNKMSYKGRGSCIVSGGLLSRNGQKDILVRQRLMTEIDLHSIILLPENIFADAKVFSVILNFIKQSPTQQEIMVIDLRGKNIAKDFSGMNPFTVIQPECQSESFNPLFIKRNDVKPPKYLLNPDRYKALLQTEEVPAIFPKTCEADGILQSIDNIFMQQFPHSTEILNGTTTVYPNGKRPGNELFILKNGKELPKEHRGKTGPYPLYQGQGICGTADICNVEKRLPTLIINRVGTYCGRIYYTDRPCYVKSSSMFLTSYDKNYDPVFLFFLFRSANFNKWKNCTTKPSIRQEVIYDTCFITPSAESQKAFVDTITPQMKQVLALWDDMICTKQEVLF